MGILDKYSLNLTSIFHMYPDSINSLDSLDLENHIFMVSIGFILFIGMGKKSKISLGAFKSLVEKSVLLQILHCNGNGIVLDVLYQLMLYVKDLFKDVLVQISMLVHTLRQVNREFKIFHKILSQKNVAYTFLKTCTY